MARRILVTGGNRGIGRAIALGFAAAGDAVAVTGRDEAALTATATAAADLPGSLHTWRLDVADRQAVYNAVPRAVEALGGLDVVVSNAGVSRRTPVDGGSEVDAIWQEVLATNLDGTWWLLRAAVPHLADGGRIMVMSSALGRAGYPGYAAYCASKHALIGLVRCLALELAPRRITVNAIAPGAVETDLLAAEFGEKAGDSGRTADELRQEALDRAPLGRFILAEEVAEMALYLASPAAEAVTAQVFGIDAGLTPHG